MKRPNLLILLLVAALSAAARAQFSETSSDVTNVPIPASGTGGAAGGVSNPANAASFTLNVYSALLVENLRVGIDIVHAAVGDLRIEVSHCGTTGVLYNQSPASQADLNGIYYFDGLESTTFSSVVTATPANGVVPPGYYAPVGSLAAFNGKNSVGAWTITIYDLTPGSTGSLLGLYLTIFDGASYASAAPLTTIPDGINGQCISPVTQVINVPSFGSVKDMTVVFSLTHTYISDLDITIQHAGVTVALTKYGAPTSGADVGGSYMFWDGSPYIWTAAEIQYSGGGTIPSGTYRPNELLSAFKDVESHGLWYITACDRWTADVGAIGAATLNIEKSPYNFQISQPNGPASIVLTNSGGTPGLIFANFFTLAPGIAPFGWLAGLDISMNDLMTQVNFGSPFLGIVGTCGTTTVVIPGPIPSNLTVWTVSFEYDAPTGTPIAIDPVQTYTTL